MHTYDDIAISRDTCATLAAVVLSELLLELANEPAPGSFYEAQNHLFAHLYACGEMNADHTMLGSVEPECLDHGVVHVHLWNGKSSDGWLQIDPVTGLVKRFPNG